MDINMFICSLSKHLLSYYLNFLKIIHIELHLNSEMMNSSWVVDSDYIDLGQNCRQGC